MMEKSIFPHLRIRPDPTPTPDDGYYVYFANTSGWNVMVWAWDSAGEPCGVSTQWPGDPMTEKNGVLYWSASAGKVPLQIIFSNAGGEKAGDGDLVL